MGWAYFVLLYYKFTVSKMSSCAKGSLVVMLPRKWRRCIHRTRANLNPMTGVINIHMIKSDEML